jgi:hypothetical protein
LLYADLFEQSTDNFLGNGNLLFQFYSARRSKTPAMMADETDRWQVPLAIKERVTLNPLRSANAGSRSKNVLQNTLLRRCGLIATMLALFGVVLLVYKIFLSTTASSPDSGSSLPTNSKIVTNTRSKSFAKKLTKRQKFCRYLRKKMVCEEFNRE